MLPSPSGSSSSSAVTGAGLAWAKSYTESESLPQRRGVLRQTYQTDTGPILNVYDQRSGVRETFQTEPKEAITDPALFEKGVQAYRLLREPPDSDETLFAGIIYLSVHPDFLHYHVANIDSLQKIVQTT